MYQAPESIINDCIKQLRSFTPGSEQFNDQVIELAVSKSALYTKMANSIWNLKSLSGTFVRHLSFHAGISTLDFVEIFEGMYGANGPLRGAGLDYYDPLPTHAKLIAAMHYFMRTDSGFINISKQQAITKQVAEIALEGGKNWQALKGQLALIELQRPQARLAESVPDLLKNLAEHLYMDSDAVFIQKVGGVERLKEVGADIDDVCRAVLKSLSTTSLLNTRLSQVHRLIVDATCELHASGTISREESNERHCRLLRAVLNAKRRDLGKDAHECYQKMMLELTPHMSKKHASDLIPRLTAYLKLDEIKDHLKGPLSIIDLSAFKSGMTKHVDAGMQYDLVVKLGIDGLFKQSELQKLKGAKLESALGL
jgi:hypothetical protein